MPVRKARMSDLLQMQNCNLINLPENYQMKYYVYHAFCWPQLLHVNEDFNGKVTGYVMAKMEEESSESEGPMHGHVTSIAVIRSHRKLGVASNLVRRSRKDVETVFGGKYLSLHVRCTNEAAVHLYQDILGFRVHAIDEKYYGDKEDALEMKLVFDDDPYGATVTKVSRTQKHSGVLVWPPGNPDGKLNYDDFLMKQQAEEKKQAAEKEAAAAPATVSARRKTNRKRK